MHGVLITFTSGASADQVLDAGVRAADGENLDASVAQCFLI